MYILAPQMMRRGYLAMKNGSWEEFKERYRKEGKSSEWTLERIREAYEKVAKDEIGRLGIVQEILRKSPDFFRVIAPVCGMGGVTFSYVCPHCNSVPLEDYSWWVSTGTRRRQQQKEEALQLVVCGVWPAQAAGEPADGWWQPDSEHRHRPT